MWKFAEIVNKITSISKSVIVDKKENKSINKINNKL